MPKLLLEYKGFPAILYHNFKKVDKINFITVYTNGQNDYIRKDFSNIESAVDFEPENSTFKLIFVNIESEEEGTNYVQYSRILVRKNQLILSEIVDFYHKGFRFSVDFGLNRFCLKKASNSIPATVYYDINYIRRRTTKLATDEKYEFIDSFYEIFPRFEDIFLETLFICDIMSANYSVLEKEELEAYFLQGKMKIEKNNKPKINKKDSNSGDISEESEEQLELSNLIGLDEIKLEIQELKALAEFRKKRLEFGLPVTPSTLHMIFMGNPGTGKTTIARLLGQIYYDIGLMTSNKVIEVSRGDLVGQYVGQTALKTQKVFESALGGILFIDEAYSLFKSGNDFGAEAVETLLKLMEDNRENVIIIIAGYPNEMEKLLDSNPGLKSRFSKTLHFKNYSKEELIQIFYKMVSTYHNKLSDGAKYKIEYLIDRYYESGYFNSNARVIRNIFEETVKNQSHRLYQKENASQDEMISFIDKDIPDELN